MSKESQSPLHSRLDQAGALLAQGRLAEMLDVLQPLSEILKDNAGFHCARGVALLTLDEPEAGEIALRRAVELEPNLLRARVYHAAALSDLSRTAEALTEYEVALRLDPESPEARTHRAMLWLSEGRLAEGWGEYEWRFKLSPHLLGGPAPHSPRWNGESLDGRTLLLMAEQGLGDTLQFVRFATAARKRGGRIILECQPELERLLQGVPGLDAVVRRGVAPPPHDAHLPLLSLPRFFCPDAASIPAPISFPAAGPIPALSGNRKRIGIAWAGGRGNTRDRSRSCPPEALTPLRALPNVEWVSLQKNEGDTPWLPFAADVEACADFLDTARVIGGLDHVIAVDTAVAHLAAGLGKPTSILLPEPACWRWMNDRERTPWYPAARLFRQARHGDWDELIRRVAAELRGFSDRLLTK